MDRTDETVVHAKTELDAAHSIDGEPFVRIARAVIKTRAGQ
jgi:hypothetical protein